MFINKTIVFIIVASLFAYGDACRGSEPAKPIPRDPITRDEYIGIWYTIATINPPRTNAHFGCEWMNIAKKADSTNEFWEIFQTTIDGKKHSSAGYGNIDDSIVRDVVSAVKSDETVYSVTKFNGGNELILHHQDTVLYSRLISRTTTASARARAAFESKAEEARAEVIYHTQGACNKSG